MSWRWRRHRSPAANLSADILVAGDNCSYAGPATIDAGSVTVALHLTSLGHNELILTSLEVKITDMGVILATYEPAGPVEHGQM